MNENIPLPATDAAVLQTILASCLGIEQRVFKGYDTLYGSPSSVVLSVSSPGTLIRAADPTAKSTSLFISSLTSNGTPVSNVDVFEGGVFVGRLSQLVPFINLGTCRGIITATLVSGSTCQMRHATYGYTAPTGDAPDPIPTENDSLIKILASMRNIEAGLIDGYSAVRTDSLTLAGLTTGTALIRSADPMAVHTVVGFPTGTLNAFSFVQVFENDVLIGFACAARPTITLQSNGVGTIKVKNMVAQTESVSALTREYTPNTEV